ncbi:hypothetical protein COCON_G00020870 [Conger conger]|uniref:Ig-like domain-containing protein n=1 Tax=Conger conger TaxID=82655 RepID=A0A9Q1DWT7_CONCO|nr:hypothetical protein COCON_G00020870 [Conger conger]
MALTLILFLSFLFLPVLPDADGVFTMSEVVVQRGRSVTIPCLYDREYESHVKYWCHGSVWNVCETVVRTDSPTVKGETSITDDPTHHVFTVTMRKLQVKDSGYYWCAVEIQGAGDKEAYLYLSVTADTPGLWVEQQEVAGVEGGHVSVLCHYNEPSSMKKWCRIESTCVEVNPGESGRSEMTDDRSEKVFPVTVRELNMEDTGCTPFFSICSTKHVSSGDHSNHSSNILQAFNLKAFNSLNTSLTCSSNNYIYLQYKNISHTLLLLFSPSDLTIILMALGMLLLVAAVATVTWKLCKRHKGVQPHTGAREDRSNELTRLLYTLHSECQLQTLKMK